MVLSIYFVPASFGYALVLLHINGAVLIALSDSQFSVSVNIRDISDNESTYSVDSAII